MNKLSIQLSTFPTTDQIRKKWQQRLGPSAYPVPIIYNIWRQKVPRTQITKTLIFKIITPYVPVCDIISLLVCSKRIIYIYIRKQLTFNFPFFPK